MAGRSVTILGFPPAMNVIKLRLFFGKISGSESVEHIGRDDGHVTCTFADEGGLRKFLEEKVKEIRFGNTFYPIQVQGIAQGADPVRALDSPSPDQLHAFNTNSNSLRQPILKVQTISPRLQESLYKDTHYWSSFSELPAGEGTMCILAKNIDQNTTIQAIKLHFESKKRACGGLVACVVNMIDGLLIIFEDPSNCLACSEMAGQKIGGREIVVFQKKIPTFYERKFVIEGVGSKTTQYTLMLFLESCLKNETSAYLCQQQDIKGVYLVEYGMEYELSETQTFLHLIQRTELEGSKLKAKCLLRTDCLKVTGVPDSASNDQIRLNFESKKRIDGGPVTRIDRLENQAVLVYFALFEDAERICKKCETLKFLINQHPVKVQLYHHSLSTDHKKVVENFQPKQEPSAASPAGAKDTLTAFQMEPTSDRKLLDFILQRDAHLGHLKTFFRSFAAVGIIPQEQKEKIVLKFTPQKIHAKFSQKEFEEKCRKNLEGFLRNYSTTVRTFDNAKLQSARSRGEHPEVQESYAGDADNNLVVSWTPNESTVAVTGLKNTVDSMIRHVENCVNNISVTRPLSEDQYGTFVHCGIISDLHERFKNLRIKCDENQLTVTYHGSDSDVQAAQIEALTAMMIDKRKLIDVDEMVVKFLSESMQKSSEISQRIQRDIKNAGAKASFCLSDGLPSIKPKTNDDFQKAIDIIKRNVVIEKINTDSAKSNVIKSAEWKSFQQTLGGSGLYGIFIDHSESITLVGIRSELKIVRAKISGFLDENAVKRFFVQLDYGKARFAIEKSHEFSRENCEKCAITCGLSPEGGGGVFVEGKRRALDDAYPDMMKLHKTILEVPMILEKPGIKEYYGSKEGKQFLSNAERANNVVILAGTNRCKEWDEHNKRTASVTKPAKPKSTIENFREKEVLRAKLPNSSVSLSVWKTDISKHKCDVIVNASNEDLALLPGGVSGVIKNYDLKNRNQIQGEMDAIVKKNGGRLLPGEAVLTTSGNLPACKSIVHAVGPRWSSASYNQIDPRLVLKQCILKSLQLTEKERHKSIAIPAISCGVFGGKVAICVPLIVETVEEYCNETPDSTITKVHFVEYATQSVLDEFVNSLKKYEKTTPIEVRTSPVLFASPTSTPIAIQQGSCTVHLAQGDIAAQQADVLVNVTDPAHLANMTNGPAISQVLAKSAGPGVVKECSRLPQPHTLGRVFETNAGGLPCKKLYHALVTHYDPQTSPSVIQSVVLSCLKKADADGHTSIVFPAIATGGFRHPPNVVAKLMRQEIANFNATSLKNVTILLYPGNQQAISEFNAEFNSGTPVSTPSPVPRTSSGRFLITQHKDDLEKRTVNPLPKSSSFQQLDDSTAMCGRLVVSICKGDITDQDTDVIVNSTNSTFVLNQGMVSKQILAKGGMEIQKEAASKAKQGVDYVVTSCGDLPCKKIIHLVTPADPNDLQKKIAKVLKEVEVLKMKSVSLPAFGTGMMKLAIDTVGSIMRASIEQFAKSNSKKLKHLDTVTIVLFDGKQCDGFTSGFFNPNLKKGIWETLRGYGENFFSLFTQSSTEEGRKVQITSFCLYLYSNDEEDINQAIKCISDEAEKMASKTVITDETISRLTEWERFEILEIEKKHNIQITERPDRYLKRLVLEGLGKDVAIAQGDINDILREFAAAEMTSTYVSWEKKVKSDKWEILSPRSAHVLERAYKARTSGSGDTGKTQVPEFMNGKVTFLSVDLPLVAGQNSPKVRRKVKEKGASDVPDFWDEMNDKQIIAVTLQPNSTEYQNVQQKLSGQTLFYTNILAIERIQNLSLYKQYLAKKAEITAKLKNFAGPIERQLFHGTGEDEKIQLNGFDRSYAGRNATMYGRGVYFATNASYSHGYAVPNQQGQRRMFLADVVTGEFCVGNQNLLAPPPRANSTLKNDIYDSVVDNGANPTIFVIFKDASAYPAYRITYV